MMRSLPAWSLGLFLIAAPAAADHPHGTTPAATSAVVPLFDNLGNHHHAITTSSPEAQRYFDQGVRLVYAFNHDEAGRAFKEAARLDPTCAMAYWGLALTLGSNYNLPAIPEREQAAYEAIQKAVSLVSHASESERAYIEALAQRHSLAPEADRKALDTAYADAMREVAKRYPDDLDAATLSAEAMMNLRPWGLWSLDGQPQPGTLEIIATLESVLQRNPDHPGAIHYYIHAVEASPQPERAVPFADRLAALVPGAGHLVHMPSHIYIRVGRYNDAADNNVRAAAIDADYIEKQHVQGLYRMMYYPHNIHFIWAAASMEGRSAEALRAARELATKLKPEMARQMPEIEFFYPTPLFALARFGKWKKILKEPAPPTDLQYTTAIWHYARGLALTATGRLDEAGSEQKQVEESEAATRPDRVVDVGVPVKSLLHLAAHALAGEIAARQGKTDEAIRLLEEAVRTQDGLPYSEPPPWYYPVRQSLGAVLLAAKRTGEAEAVYREDLKRNPENGWSLYGLRQSLRARKAKEEAAAVEKRFRKAWARADVTLTASRF